jgi:hypothetical protein
MASRKKEILILKIMTAATPGVQFSVSITG